MREHGTPEHGTPEHGTPEHGWAASAASMPASKRVANPSPSGDRFLPTGLPASERHALSERELEIVELVATGLTNQEIAAQLMISKRTVDNHVSNIFTKTGAKNRVALLNWAMDHGKICRDGFNCCQLPQPEKPAASGPGSMPTALPKAPNAMDNEASRRLSRP